MKKIAVTGTGIMGSGIAANYLKAGYQVFLWNRTKEKLDAHVQRMGGTTAMAGGIIRRYQAQLIFPCSGLRRISHTQKKWQQAFILIHRSWMRR